MGGTIDEPEIKSATIIAFLPIDEDLLKYWDDASDIEYTEHDKIEFSDRFPKPKYFVELPASPKSSFPLSSSFSIRGVG